MKPLDIAAYVLCVAADVFLVRAELNSDDAGILAGLVLLAALLLASLHPRHAWQWALLVGPAIPAADLLFGPTHSFDPKLLAFVLALGFVGAYTGVLLRKTFSAAADLYR